MTYEPFSKSLPENLKITKDMIEGFGYNALEDHGITHIPIEWNNSKAYHGVAKWTQYYGQYTATRIVLSNFFFDRMTDKRDMVDTVLHEVAHVLAIYFQNDHKHSLIWKSWCRKVGANPQRIGNKAKEYKVGDFKYDAFCPKCGHIGGYSRRVKYDYSCRHCSNGVYNPKYKIKLVQNW